MNRFWIIGSIVSLSACTLGAQQAIESGNEAVRVVSSDSPSLDSSEGWYASAPGVWERVTDDGAVQRVSRGRQGLAADLDAARAMHAQLDPEAPEAIRAELEQRIKALEAMQASLEKTAQTQKTVSCGGTRWLLTATANCTYTQGSANASSQWSIGFSPRTPSETYASARAFHDGVGQYVTDSGDSFNAAQASASSSVISSEICSSSAFASVTVPSCNNLYESLRVTCRCR